MALPAPFRGARTLTPAGRELAAVRFGRPAPRASPGRLRVLAQQPRFGTQLIGGSFGGANQIFVAGAEGQLGVRVVQKLLQSGFKVVAGVPDEERAKGIVAFATSVELLSKQDAQRLSLTELDLADVESIAAALPKRGARVVVVTGDAPAKGQPRLDARAAGRILEAATEANASQFVLVAPAAAKGGGGFFGALFGGGGGSVAGSGAKPSKLEQDIAASGLDFAIVRTGNTDAPGLGAEEAAVALGPQGSLPPQPRISRGQVAEVVAQVVKLAGGDVLLEAWADPTAAPIAIEEAVAAALPAAAITEEGAGEEAEPEPVAAEAEEDEEEAPKRPLFGGFGTRKVKAGASASEEQPQQPEALEPAAGTRRVRGRPAFSFGGKQPLAEEAEAEAEEEGESPQKGGGLRGIFGSKKAEPAEVGPDAARKSAARGIKAAGAQPERVAAAQKREEVEGGEAKPKKGGFLGALGLGGGTKFVESED